MKRPPHLADRQIRSLRKRLSLIALVAFGASACGSGTDVPLSAHGTGSNDPVSEQEAQMLPAVTLDEMATVFQHLTIEHPEVPVESVRFQRLYYEAIRARGSASPQTPLIQGLGYGPRLSNAEVWLLLSHPSNVLATKSASDDAIATARIIFPGETSLEDSISDAFRHSYWNVLLSKRISEDWAEVFTTAHESGDPSDAHGVLARAMDLHNNSIGRALFHANLRAAPDPEFADRLRRHSYVIVTTPAAIADQAVSTDLVFIKYTVCAPAWCQDSDPCTDDQCAIVNADVDCTFTRDRIRLGCSTCVTHQSKRCDGGGVFYFDSCGNREELVTSCDDGDECTTDACTAGSCTHSLVQGCATICTGQVHVVDGCSNHLPGHSCPGFVYPAEAVNWWTSWHDHDTFRTNAVNGNFLSRLSTPAAPALEVEWVTDARGTCSIEVHIPPPSVLADPTDVSHNGCQDAWLWSNRAPFFVAVDGVEVAAFSIDESLNQNWVPLGKWVAHNVIRVRASNDTGEGGCATGRARNLVFDAVRVTCTCP